MSPPLPLFASCIPQHRIQATTRASVAQPRDGTLGGWPVLSGNTHSTLDNLLTNELWNATYSEFEASLYLGFSKCLESLTEFSPVHIQSTQPCRQSEHI